VIEPVDTDDARTLRNLLFVNRGTGDARSAAYDEDLVRTADRWRIARCRCRVIVPDDLSDRPAR